MESKTDLWNVVCLEYTWRRGQCWCFYDKPRLSVKRPDICETELLSPAEKEEWIFSYLNCQQHSNYNTVSQAFTHSLTYPHNHSPILSPVQGRLSLQWQPTLDNLTGYISSRPMTCTSGCYYNFEYSWWWTQKAFETCSVILQWLINNPAKVASCWFFI